MYPHLNSWRKHSHLSPLHTVTQPCSSLTPVLPLSTPPSPPWATAALPRIHIHTQEACKHHTPAANIQQPDIQRQSCFLPLKRKKTHLRHGTKTAKLVVNLNRYYFSWSIHTLIHCLDYIYTEPSLKEAFTTLITQYRCDPVHFQPIIWELFAQPLDTAASTKSYRFALSNNCSWKALLGLPEPERTLFFLPPTRLQQEESEGRAEKRPELEVK